MFTFTYAISAEIRRPMAIPLNRKRTALRNPFNRISLAASGFETRDRFHGSVLEGVREKFCRMATTLASQSDSYPKASRQSNHADVSLIPRHLGTISAAAYDHGGGQSRVVDNLSAPQTRLIAR